MKERDNRRDKIPKGKNYRRDFSEGTFSEGTEKRGRRKE